MQNYTQNLSASIKTITSVIMMTIIILAAVVIFLAIIIYFLKHPFPQDYDMDEELQTEEEILFVYGKD